MDIQVVTTVDSTAVAWDTASTSATVSDADLTVPAFTLTNSGVSVYSFSNMDANSKSILGFSLTN